MKDTNAKIPVDLNALSEENLLQVRICDLPLSVEGTWLQDCIQQLYQELSAKGLTFQPECYLADEWLTPVNEPTIGIPFYLAHPTLIKLEKKMMLEVEGESKEWCLKLLRHETGHAISYAYRLHMKRKWKEMFGSPDEEYGENYRFRPYSKNFVRHLDGFYAQYHPDEDFVETFAVWLTPGLDWEKQYAGWKALEKLKFVDQLMKGITQKPAVVKKGKQHWHFRKLRITLKNFYKKKRFLRAEAFPEFYDMSLKRIFSEKTKENQDITPAVDIIKKYRNVIINDVANWTGEKKYVVNNFLKIITGRCRELQLGAKDPEQIVLVHLTSYTTTLIMNYIYTGWYRGDKNKRKK